MIDLIIPVYKNIPGLYKTLLSVGINKNILCTIVDDCSGDDYSEIIKLFEKFFPIRVLTLSENSGPGVARQFGLSKTSEPYVMFIDCGDTFYSTETIPQMIDCVTQNPEINMFSWGHFEGNNNSEPMQYCPSGHNRMHGKIYKRDFLVKYEITFPVETSRAQEDIGFNHNCRAIIKNIALTENKNTLLEINEPAVVWQWDDNSIVRSNSCAYFYQKQTIGLALGMIHAKKNLEKNNVDKSIIRDMVYQGITATYDFYLCTLVKRPEFMEEALAGCIIFYKELFKPIENHDKEKLLEEWNAELRTMICEDGYPAFSDFISIDFLGFLNYLEELSNKKEPD